MSPRRKEVPKKMSRKRWRTSPRRLRKQWEVMQVTASCWWRLLLALSVTDGLLCI
ncbi:hypothetical protein E2C01_075984 [Portunus trituberculatus]|uniref:Uncharacterized protein n=1 Tax=Portunus trituberculatus TaxID=210409 RepID=A0A5B7IGB7_PORTR|nr:hypothetical protein [Portunus trituberculatus]